MLNGLKPYNYLTYVMEQMKDLSPFPEKEAMQELLPWSNSLPADLPQQTEKMRGLIFPGIYRGIFIFCQGTDDYLLTNEIRIDNTKR